MPPGAHPAKASRTADHGQAAAPRGKLKLSRSSSPAASASGSQAASAFGSATAPPSEALWELLQQTRDQVSSMAEKMAEQEENATKQILALSKRIQKLETFQLPPMSEEIVLASPDAPDIETLRIDDVNKTAELEKVASELVGEVGVEVRKIEAWEASVVKRSTNLNRQDSIQSQTTICQSTRQGGVPVDTGIPVGATAFSFSCDEIGKEDKQSSLAKQFSPTSSPTTTNQLVWRIVLDFFQRCNADGTEGKQDTIKLYEAQKPTDQPQALGDAAWLTALQPKLLDALSQVGLQGTDIMQTRCLKVGDCFEPESLPWWVRIGAADVRIDLPLPGPSGRKPWGVVNHVDQSGNVFCQLLITNKERRNEKVQVSACVVAKYLSKVRPKRKPSLPDMLGAPTLTELLQEYPALGPFITSKGADLARCALAWRENDHHVRNLVAQAHVSKALQPASMNSFPSAVVLSTNAAANSLCSA